MSTKSTADLARFSENRFGMFIHWGLYSMFGGGEWLRNEKRISNEEQQKYFDNWNPRLFNPKAWAQAARKAGMRYVVVTSKHHEGFCLWDSKFTCDKAPNTPFGRDALREIVDAFRAEGLRIGLYYSLIDWQHEHYTIDRFHPLRDRPDRDELNHVRDLAKYTDYLHNQIRELLTGYGQIDILWFDFAFPPENGDLGKGREEFRAEELVRMIRTLQPGIILNNRLDMPEESDIETPEQYTLEEPLRDKDGCLLAWEGCHTVSGAWCYHFAQDASWKSPRQCLNLLIDNVSANGNLLLNVGPTSLGEIDPRSQESLDFIAKWMRMHSDSIYGCGCAPESFVAPRDCRYTYNASTRRLFLHIMNWPFKFITLKGLSDKIAYAQFLHDGTELCLLDERKVEAHPHLQKRIPKGAAVLELPIQKPDVEIPVIELRLR